MRDRMHLKVASVRHAIAAFVPRDPLTIHTQARLWTIFGTTILCVCLAVPAAAQEMIPPSSAGWSGFSPRAETAPGLAASPGGDPDYSLEVHGNGVPNVYGGWRTRINGLIGGNWYRFRARALPTDIASPRESVTILLRWRGAFGDEVAPDYVWNYRRQSDGTLLFDRMVQAPQGTTNLDVELVLQWAPSGRVRFDDLSLVPSAAPSPRQVKAAAVYFRPAGTSSGLQSVQQAAQHGEQVAAAHRPDVMVFGELLNVIGAPGTYDQKAETVPGPSTDVMAGLARAFGMYVVFGVLEREGRFLYNSAVLLDRSGNIAGKYRKLQLPDSEASGGITPGDNVPVFETDFGRVALLICQDTAFPEPAREAAIQGAEMLLVPIWGGKQAVVHARAIEQSMYILSSGYDYPSEVVDPLGRVLDAIDTLAEPGAAVATIDLSRRFREAYSGDWRDTSNKQRRTSPYTADATHPPGGDPPVPPDDTSPPAVSMTAPANGATVSGIVSVSANTSDNVGVTRVRFAIDGAVIVDDTGAPYSTSWDSRTAADGMHTLSATAFDAAGNSSSSSINVTVSNTSPGGSTPFTGTPVSLPGRIEAENFDDGGANVAYFDTTAGNRGGVYRETDVDLEPTGDTGGGFNLAKIRATEWLKYTVNVGAAGTYTLRVRVASLGPGGTFHVESNGVDLTGGVTVPDTGGWQNWATVTTTVTLPAGQQVLRFFVDAESAGGFGNVNWLEVASASSGSTPFSGTPAPLPGRIEAENFDHGGANVAFLDTTSVNEGGAYRQTAVDIEPTSDTGGGHNVGWMRAGEWLHYTVNVATSGTYTLRVRVAADGTGGRFHFESDGVDRSGPIAIPDTGGWQSWTTISATITLAAGQQVLRLLVDEDTAGIFGNINWFELVSQ